MAKVPEIKINFPFKLKDGMARLLAELRAEVARYSVKGAQTSRMSSENPNLDVTVTVDYCKDCKGTGKILLLTSTVPCACQEAPTVNDDYEKRRLFQLQKEVVYPVDFQYVMGITRAHNWSDVENALQGVLNTDEWKKTSAVSGEARFRYLSFSTHVLIESNGPFDQLKEAIQLQVQLFNQE
jgi:hypothetical protein